MRLYYFERVLEEERKQEVIAALKTAAKRRNARKLVVQEQTENLLALVARMKVKVRACSRERLIAAAIRAYNDHHWEDIESAHIGSDPAFLTRIQVNYVRHQLTDYDARLESVASRVGVRKAEDAIREKVYAAIGAAYPEFKDECAAQLKRRREMDHYAWAAWQ